MIDIKNLTISSAHKSLSSKEFSSVDLLNACLKNIEDRNSELFAFIEVFSDAKEQAEEADKMIAEGKATPLTGIPFAIKDNILFEGHIASASSKALSKHTATYSAPIIKKLREMGAVVIGRTNMDEFAMGSSTENSSLGVTKNPFDSSRVAGGSSGGSASALASGMCLFALGTDTGGSVRQPAGFCGVVGYKGSYGSVSRSGIISMGNSLDQVGPMTKNSDDLKIVFDAISFFDNNDATSIPENLRNKDTKEFKKIGVPWGMIEREGIDGETLANFKETISKLEKEGNTIVPIDLPLTEYSLAVYYIIMPAEVSTNLSRFDGIRYGSRVDAPNLFETYTKSRREGFGPETRRRVMLGTYVLSHGYYDAYYKKAINMKSAIRKELLEVFKTVDVIATPTTPSPAFRVGEKSDPLQMYLSDIFTVPANIVGFPAISIPNKNSSNGLPLDIQFMASDREDSSLIAFSQKFEKIKE